jgi:purine-cytosine permease-like protein
VGVTVAGACVVAVPLVLLGAVLAVSAPGLATVPDPVSFLGETLPTWIAVPYLLIALTGTLLINVLSMYSAGFTAQTLGLRVSRLRAVLLNAVISLVLGALLMVAARGFLADFTAFLSLLAVAFSAWGGVFGADMLRRTRYDGAALADTGPAGAYWYRHGFAPAAVIAWAVGLVAGLLFLRSAWFDGPLARGTAVGDYGLGWVATMLVSALLYLALPKPPVRGG